ncbi:MAG: SGNH/GDSL hydrolase family protein [Proteobacteria bacterium]|nr:SGNH/GDSL hydrolase family protein [Pseudomonadota bacterium]
MKSFLSNLLWIVTTLVVSLLIIEGVSRAIYSRKLDYQIEMSRYAATLKRSSAHYEVGHEHRPSQSVHLMGVDVVTNSHGFRSAEVTLEKPEDVYRVMLLGDSLTLGWGVEVEEIFARHLEDGLRQRLTGPGRVREVQVINTGVGNYNTDQEVAFFEARGRAFQPDLVILNYFINDAEPTPRKKSPFLLQYSYLGMSLWGRLDLFKRLYLTQNDFSNYYPGLYEEDQAGWRRARDAMGRLARLAEENGFGLVMFLLPELHAVGPQYGFEEIYDRVRAAALAAGVPHVFDLSPAFAREQPETLWVSMDDAHPNAKAHAILARGMHDELDRIDLSELGAGR